MYNGILNFSFFNQNYSRLILSYTLFLKTLLAPSRTAKYKIGVQIAVEIELMTVAGKLTKELTKATFKLVPTINASTIETQ